MSKVNYLYRPPRSMTARFAVALFWLSASAITGEAQTVSLPYNPVTAEYSYGLDRIIFISANPNQLHIFDPISQSDIAVSLSQPPLSLSVSPDGLHAAVGHNSLVSYINLQNASVQATFPSSVAVSGVVLATDYVYILNLQSDVLSIELSSGTTSSFRSYGAISGRLHPSGNAFYATTEGSIEDFNVSTGPVTAMYNGAYSSGGSVCIGVWLSPDGRRVYSACASVSQASPQDTGVQTCCGVVLDTNADGLYWTRLGGTLQIVSLNESAILGRVAAIPAQSPYLTFEGSDNQVFFYDSAYLDPAGTFQLPDFVVDGQNYQAHGKQVFYNQASTYLYVVMQADSTSGLLEDFAVQIFSLSNPPACSTTLTPSGGTAPAAGTVATSSITASSGCSYEASSDSPWIQFVSGASGSGNGTLTYIVRPNSGDARSGAITVGSQSFTVTQAAATVSANGLEQLGYSVAGADYSKALDRVILLVKNPKELHIYDPIGGSDQIVRLPKTPLFLSVSPDGLSAGVGYDGWVSIVNLAAGSVTSTTQVFGDAQTLLLAGNGYVYPFVQNQNGNLFSIQLATGTITASPAFPPGYYPRLDVGGNAFYTEGSIWSISSGVAQSLPLGYSGCAPLWLTEDGTRLINSCGEIYTTPPVPPANLLPDGSFSNIPATLNYGAMTVQWAVESENLRSTAVIPAVSNSDQPGTEDTSIQIYGDETLTYSGSLSLPSFLVGSTSYPGHGRYAFWNNSEDRLIVLEQADSTANLLADYGAMVYSVTTPLPGCSFTLGSASAGIGANGGVNSVSVNTVAGCIWQATSYSPWLTVSSGGVGAGSNTVLYSVAANTGAAGRSGALIIGGQTFTIVQAGSTSAGTATHFFVAAPASATAGSPLSFTVMALDANNQTVAGYSDPVQFTSTDGAATLPADAILNGTGTFSASLVTAGPQTITVTDSLKPSITGTSAIIAISPSSGLRYIAVSPCRVVDTRNAAGPFGAPFVPASGSRSFSIPNSTNCSIPSTAQAYSLNLTVVPHGTLGYLTMWPTGVNQAVVSTLNSIDGRVKANAAIVPAGDNGAVSVFATNDTDVVLDINGYFVATSNSNADSFYPTTPCRLIDTRAGVSPTVSSGALAGGSSRTLPLLSSNCNVPATATAYSLNFTVVPASGTLGYLTVYPTGVAQPVVSTLNAPTGTVVANAAIIPAGTAGSIDVFATDPTDLIVDINGYFAPPGTGGLSFYSLPPCRVLDTRNPPGSPPFDGQIDPKVLPSGLRRD